MDANFIPPPAYSEEEFDQKMSKASELSLELAKWETPEVEIDEEGFPRYDPAMFEEPSRAQKRKDQPATTTFRSSSISKRPLPNPKSSTSSNNAGPSTLRQTQPLHISKKSISKAEEAAQETSRHIPAPTHTPEDIPPYAAHPVSAPSSQSIPAQSIDDTPEDNPPYTAMDPHFSNSSVPTQRIDDTPEDNPPYEPNYASDLPYTEQPQRENWEEGIGTPGQDVISEPVPDEPLDRPQSSELEPPEHLGQGHEILNSNTVTTANQMLDRYSMASNPPFHRGPQNPNTTTMSNQMRDSQSQYSMAPNPPFHRGLNTATMSNQVLDSQPQYSMPPNPPFHRGLDPSTATVSNQMRDSRSQYSVAQQHFSLPPAPRILPRNHPSDRLRSHSTSPSTSPQPAITPRVLFNPNVAYGINAMGGQLAQIRPKVHTLQTPQAPYDPTTFYK